ncbi:hypothetical protein BDN72DRAFT_835849 [Pluteus cervinus]|uniref:Uncharacterized protein n=1 Tax=Pluteus cervinus TaxID=181527 RepID=A0ACD3B6Z1_9AGAR|nr:hypothetical protein BDN72DRAFT_835849 [Pluteus cervinus]
MSVDFEWAKLDSSLASRLVDILNRQLSNTKRPSFIGPVAVTSLEFGSVSPDVELVDLCDIYRDFLEDDEDEDDDKDPVKVTEGGVGLDGDHDDGYEWVSRRVVNRDETRAYQHLPPHIRYGYGRGGTADLFSSVPSLHPSSNAMGPPPEYWNPATSVPSLSVPHNLYDRAPSPGTPFSATAIKQHDAQMSVEEPQWSSRVPRAASLPLPLPTYRNGPGSDDLSSGPAVSTIPPGLQTTPSLLPSRLSQTHTPEPDPTTPPPALYPNLQMHFHINWHSDLRITLTTSLLINYPSTMFMSLPIKLSVTGLLFTGEVVVAYEGERKRVHLCILDELDPYGPAGERPKRDSLTGGTTPPELDDEHHANGHGNLSGGGRPAKPLPVGHRLLPSIYIESEIGQADKHVLKNVGRVEKFIQDVIRKTVEEELVFPNFHTLILGEQ